MKKVPFCVECGHPRTQHNEDTMWRECQLSTCDCESWVGLPPQPAGNMPGHSVMISQAELTQLRAKVEVYEKRHTKQLELIEENGHKIHSLNSVLHDKNEEISILRRVADGFKNMALAHHEMLKLLIDAERVSKQFAEVFLKPIEEDLMLMTEPIEAHICEDDDCCA